LINKEKEFRIGQIEPDDYIRFLEERQNKLKDWVDFISHDQSFCPPPSWGKKDKPWIEWIDAQIKIAESRLDPEKRINNYKDVIKILTENYPSEIKNLEIHSLLAHAYLDKKDETDFGTTLFHAQQAVALDPETSTPRTTLGIVHYNYRNYDKAKAEWEISQSIDPENSDYLNYYANLNMKKAINLRKPDERRETLSKAIKNLQGALEIMESRSLNGKNSAEVIKSHRSVHFWLGTIYYEMEEYDKAISHLIIAKELKPPESPDSSGLVVRINLGAAYWMNKAYEAGESEFKQLIKEVNDLIKNKTVKAIDPVGSDLGFVDISVGYELALAHLNLSNSYAERDANLNEALRLAGKAGRFIKDIKENKERFQARRAFCIGLILYKQGRLLEI
jgi:tetratricopeptide (TPR) repeat protein